MDRVDAGRLQNRLTGQEEAWEMIRLDAGCCPEILSLQHRVAAQIALPGSYYALSEAEVMAILAGGSGRAVGVRVGAQLIAFCFVLFPGAREDNLGRDLGLPGAELEQVAHLEAAVVHPAFRGNALQQKMAAYLAAGIGAAGRWRYLMNTVAPLNTPSLKTTLALGLLIWKLKVKYNDVWRYVFCNDLVKPVRIDAANVIRISAADFGAQQEVLASGYYGFDLESRADGRTGAAVILYGKEAFR